MLYKLKVALKNLGIKVLLNLRPQATLRWGLSAVAWIVVLAYIGVGIYFGIKVYHNHSEDKATKFAIKVYPYPAVIVNGNIIWANAYYQQLKYIEQFSAKTQQSVPNQSALKGQITDQLIETNLLAEQAVKNHITVSNKEVNDAFQQIVDQSGGTTEVTKVLNDLYGMNQTDFKKLVRQQVLKEKVQNNLMIQVKVSHILIKDEGVANTVAGQAKAGGDFAALAKQYSEDSQSAPSGGELGWLGKGQLVVNNNAIPEFDTAAFSAAKGDIVGPVKTTIGFEIIKIEDKRGKINDTYDNWFAGIKAKAKIKVLIK